MKIVKFCVLVLLFTACKSNKNVESGKNPKKSLKPVPFSILNLPLLNKIRIGENKIKDISKAMKKPGVVLIRDQKTLNSWFLKRKNQIDFTKNNVLSIFRGQKPSTGYLITILSVKGNENLIEVICKIHMDRGPGGRMITHPKTTILIPKSKKVKIIITSDDSGQSDFKNGNLSGVDIEVR